MLGGRPARRGDNAAVTIDATAFVHPTAELGEGVVVERHCIVEAATRIGAGSRLRAHAIVRSGCELGAGVLVDSFAVLGGDPQMRVLPPDLGAGRVVVGDRTVLREGVTINRPTTRDGRTEVGADCFLMAYTHVGHDCRVADHVTTANNVMLAGHVTVGAHTFVGGGAGVHQFVRIGESAMIAGNAAISYDVPPFVIAADRNDLCGLNLVGIRRRGFGADAQADLKRCFRAVLFGGGNPRLLAAAALAAGTPGTSPQGRAFLEFFQSGKRGFARARRGAGSASAE